MTDKQKNFVLHSEALEILLFPGHEYTIGRDPGNHIHLDTENVSRFHAVLRVSYDGCILEDKSSTNGTFVNGIRVGKTGLLTLSIGDRVRFGDQDFILVSDE